MRESWQNVAIEDVATVVNGGTPKTKIAEFWDGEHLWITPAEMGNRSGPYLAESRRKLTDAGLRGSSACLVPPRSVILSTRAPIGHLVINTEEMAFNQGCRGIVPGEKLNYKYLYYFLHSSVGRLDDLGSGTTFKELAAGKLKKFEIPLAPLSEQKRIVAILDEAFAGIDAAIANTENNLANARELFESYLNSVFCDKNEEWSLFRLSDLGRITSSKRIFKNEYFDEGVPFLRTKEIKELADERPISKKLFISESRYQEIEEKHGVPRAGDVLMTAIGTIGEIYVVREGDRFYFKDGNILWFKDFEGVNEYFLKFALRSFVEHIKRLSHGSAYNALPIEKLRKYKIAIPDMDTQLSIVKNIEDMWSECQRLKSNYLRKLDVLEELKQSLLQKAFSGELTAETTEKEADEAVA